MSLQLHAKEIYTRAIKENMPNEAVKRAVDRLESEGAFSSLKDGGRLALISIGKAGWEMARTAYELLESKIDCGAVITKYDHAKGSIGRLEIYEAGHPVVDFNGISATKRALDMVRGYRENDVVLFLISGGGSALFEDVSCPLEKMQELTTKLLKSGADINEINAIRKHDSNVKGGKLAKLVSPAKVYAVALSDVVGDDLSTIASGPAAPDTTTVAECLDILDRYAVELDEEMTALIKRETPKVIDNAAHIVSGSVTMLCKSAKESATELGYKAVIVDDGVKCSAAELGEKIKQLAEENKDTSEPLAFIFGGEITLKVKGGGKGGRNQELALISACNIKDIKNAAVFCIGSDGTDGPTDAAGGYADAYTYEKIAKKGKTPEEYLNNNDSYNALSLSDGLIFTGPTGTNVNDLYVLLLAKK